MKRPVKKLLSIALTAAMMLNMGVISALAEGSMYSVTVQNIKGGFLAVTYEDGEDRYILPIGKTVQLPAGTELDIRFEEVYDEDSDYETVNSGITLNGDAYDDDDECIVSEDLVISAKTYSALNENSSKTHTYIGFSAHGSTLNVTGDLADFSEQLYRWTNHESEKLTDDLAVDHAVADLMSCPSIALFKCLSVA